MENVNSTKASVPDKIIGLSLVLAVAGGASYAVDRTYNDGSGLKAVQSKIHDVRRGPLPTTPEACMAALPIEQRLARLVMIGVEGNQLPSASSEFQKLGIGGALILSSPSDASNISSFKSTFKVPPIVAVDYEGGLQNEGGVQRIRQFGELPLAQTVPDLMTVSDYRSKVRDQGVQLKNTGVDWILGPNAAVAPKVDADPMPGRSFSSDSLVVSRYTKAAVQGWLDAGLTPFVKGFGGVNPLDAKGNSVAVPFADIRDTNLRPYKYLRNDTAIANRIGIQVSNSPLDGLTENVPASASSKVVTTLLRNQLGYKSNIVITDSYNSPEIRAYNPVISRVAIEALAAGNTMVLIHKPNNGVSVQYQIEKFLELGKASVASHKLSETTVNADVERLLAYQGKTACNLIR